jgi:methyl-accepting chemotaxis protein
VVATEVRSLAQRASDSAKDIKGLIDHATASVAEGASLVSSTDDALSRFVLQVAEISSVIGSIAETAQDQATGLSEVNLAIGDLDRATQQNAAMVEQATAATQSLSKEASKLAGHLEFFKVARATGVARSPAENKKSRPASHPAPIQKRRAAAASTERMPQRQPESAGWEEF